MNPEPGGDAGDPPQMAQPHFSHTQGAGGHQSDGIVSDLRLTFFTVFQEYGWFIILGLVTLYYAYNKLNIMRNTPSRGTSSSASAGGSSTRASGNSTSSEDPLKFLERQEKIAAARARMQEKLDAQVEVEKTKIREREEKERENKIQQWENLQSGKGYYSKTKKPEADVTQSDISNADAKIKKSTAANPKRDYNPLMGGSGSSGDSCSWRPGMRRMGGGG